MILVESYTWLTYVGIFNHISVFLSLFLRDSFPLFLRLHLGHIFLIFIVAISPVLKRISWVFAHWWIYTCIYQCSFPYLYQGLQVHIPSFLYMPHKTLLCLMCHFSSVVEGKPPLLLCILTAVYPHLEHWNSFASCVHLLLPSNWQSLKALHPFHTPYQLSTSHTQPLSLTTHF